MSETLGHFLDSVAAIAPDAEAVAHAPTATVTSRLTWRMLQDESRAAARKLLSLGVTKGTHVGFLCSNRMEWLPIAFGALRLGAVLVPFSTLWKRGEIEYALTHAEVEVLITLSSFRKHDYLESLVETVPELDDGSRPLQSARAPKLRHVVLLDGAAGAAICWDDLREGDSDGALQAAEKRVSRLDQATIFFTSGTTAKAKAVVHGHAALTTSARRMAPCFGIGPGDAWWGHMPLFWSGGFVLGALATMAGGGRIVLQEVVDAGAALELLETERCTIMAGWHQAGPLLEHPDFGKRRLHLKKGTNHPLATRLLGTDHCAIGVYGMSETATCVTAARWDDPEEIRTGTFGRPLEGMVVRITDAETGRALGANETGEIRVKGPTLMDGYYGVPLLQTLDAGGFFRTGDLGFFDAAGYLHFATRLKDVIKTAGVNVAAIEVEQALEGHPAVKSAHVVGVADPVRGENVAAFVVLSAHGSAGADELRAYCRGSIASYKVPRHVFIVSEREIPRTGTGKIEKPALRQEAESRLAAGSRLGARKKV